MTTLTPGVLALALILTQSANQQWQSLSDGKSLAGWKAVDNDH